jgi:hypothetical protein
MSFPSWYHKPTSLDKPHKMWQVTVKGGKQHFPYIFNHYYEAICYAWLLATDYPSLKVYCKRV